MTPHRPGEKCRCPEAHCHCGGHLSIVCSNGCEDAEVSLVRPNPVAALPLPRGRGTLKKPPRVAKYPPPAICRKCDKPVAKRPLGPGKGRPPCHCEEHMWKKAPAK